MNEFTFPQKVCRLGNTYNPYTSDKLYWGDDIFNLVSELNSTTGDCALYISEHSSLYAVLMVDHITPYGDWFTEFEIGYDLEELLLNASCTLPPSNTNMIQSAQTPLPFKVYGLHQLD